MNDRELLELAAKAAGLDVEFMAISGANIVSGEHCGLWRPLDDDGDALRLAIRLGVGFGRCFQVVIDSEINRTGVRHTDRGGKYDSLEYHARDPYAATRRAIVRAAAEIGKAMP